MAEGWSATTITASSRCYARGNVSGGQTAGGLVGYSGNSSCTATISDSIAVGTVTGSSPLGGLVGENDGTITNSFWDSHTGTAPDCYQKALTARGYRTSARRS